MNDRISTKSKWLEIDFQIPDELCDLQEDGIECEPLQGYQKSMLNKYVILMVNQSRFIQDQYNSDDAVVRESLLLWMDFPTYPIKQLLSVKETQITRNDLIVGQFQPLTEIQ